MADEQAYDPFKTETGLPDDFDGCIVSAEFRYHATLMEFGTSEPQVGMAAKIMSDDPEIGEGGEYEAWFKTGKGWAPADNGARIERTDGKKPNFHNTSHMGLLVDSLSEIDAPFRERYQATGKGPMDAEFWEGFNAHWERKDFKGGGDVKDYQKLLPNKFIEWVSGSNGQAPSNVTQLPTPAAGPTTSTPAAATPTPAPAPAAAPAEKSAPAAAPAEGGLIKGVDKGTWDTLFGIAYAAANFNAFVEQAYATYPKAGPEVQAVIDDQAPDSIWELAVAKWKADNTPK